MSSKKRSDGKIVEELFVLALREKEPRKQVECYTKSLEINPRYAMEWFGKGVAFCELGKYEEAINCFDIALKISPRRGLAKKYTFYKLRKYEGTLKCHDKALKLNLRDAAAWYNTLILCPRCKLNPKWTEVIEM